MTLTTETANIVITKNRNKERKPKKKTPTSGNDYLKMQNKYSVHS